MYSIHRKLSLSIIMSMIVLLSLTAVFLYYRVASHVAEVFDSALFDKAQALISLTELDEEGLEFDFADDGVMLEFQREDDVQYYELWQRGGERLIKSPSLGDHALPLQGIEVGAHRFADLRLADGRAGRLIEIGFLPRIEVDEDEDGVVDPATAKPIVLVVARERESLDDTLFAIAGSILAVGIVVLLITALLVWRLVGRGLAPLSSLASQVGGIDESRLDARLTHQGAQSLEIAPIETQLNHLLERLQSAFEREKRFTSNVAHELRTPLSELRTLAEVGRMLPEDREQVVAFFNDVGDISAQMEKVVITLLELARSEAGLLHCDPENIELAPFCEALWRQLTNGQAPRKSLVTQIPQGLVVNTDREKLSMILGNLLINAISYSPEQAEIHLDVRLQGEYVVLEVSNAVTDLRPEDILHMKDRFWRKNKSYQSNQHSGLGLALVDALTRVLRIEVGLQLDEQGVFMVTLAGLPLASAKA